MGYLKFGFMRKSGRLRCFQKEQHVPFIWLLDRITTDNFRLGKGDKHDEDLALGPRLRTIYVLYRELTLAHNYSSRNIAILMIIAIGAIIHENIKAMNP